METKLIYPFQSSAVQADTPSGDPKDLLGGKGASLIQMARLGIPVPPGLVITTQLCTYYERERELPPAFEAQLKESIDILEGYSSAVFAPISKPLTNSKTQKKRQDNVLLLSVRSGAPVSMPGMMDTVLNLGLNTYTTGLLGQQTQNPRFALDSYRRFIQMFGEIVLRIDGSRFSECLDTAKKKARVAHDHLLEVANLEELIAEYKSIIKKESSLDFPEDGYTQLMQTVKAILDSWNNKRAVYYRRLNNIPQHLGTAVTVQAMVFGNLGNDSGTGVAFTRNPTTGENQFYGEYLVNAQGEDVVSGIRTPKLISQLESENPKVYRQLKEIRNRLEEHFLDMQDIEFTVQNGELYLLQTRSGKRTAMAEINIAMDFYKEGKITKEQLIKRIDPESIAALLVPLFTEQAQAEAEESGRLLAQGLSSGGGAASGHIALSAEEAIWRSERGESVILVRQETDPNDVICLDAIQGILTSTGGVTSHAAVVARGMNKACVVGCTSCNIHLTKLKFDPELSKGASFSKLGKIDFASSSGVQTLHSGDLISIDGNTGQVYLGGLAKQDSLVMKYLMEDIDLEQAAEDASLEKKTALNFLSILQWADTYRRMQIRANADTAEDALRAVKLGSDGIGLCRTEHMFFEKKHLKVMREAILSEDTDSSDAIMSSLEAYQENDFEKIFQVMDGRPVTIRLLDPPLHEFLPKSESEQRELAESLGIRITQLKTRIELLQEVNPMLGHRGCRLGISRPIFTRMQVSAIIKAAIRAQKKGYKVSPEIMVPLVGYLQEFILQKNLIDQTAAQIMEQHGVQLSYKVGTMIEVPRAVLQAKKIAEYADFFSFGTNDLTQMTLGLSRDDSSDIIQDYMRLDIYAKNPFSSLDIEGVGRLIEMAAKDGRLTKKNLHIGVCGEHGGDPESIAFFHKNNFDYVSCSPFRLLAARLVAAQEALG